MLVNWMFAPFLADAIVGCFVRLHIGDREDKQVYRLCEIEGVDTTENKYYVDKTITNKVLKLRHADAVKCWPMDIVSNQYVDQVNIFFYLFKYIGDCPIIILIF